MSELSKTLQLLRSKATNAAATDKLLIAYVLNAALDDIEHAIELDKHKAALAAVKRQHRKQMSKLGLRMFR